MKIALVHDDFTQEGGAERLFAEIAKIYPDAPIYTALVDWTKIPQSIALSRIRTSFIQKIPLAQKFYKTLLPLYPMAFESFDLSDYDLVISSTTRFAKSVITKPNAAHICYINSIPRFLHESKKQNEYLTPFLSSILKPYFSWLAKWDVASSARVDFYVANSKNVQKKIKKIYKRDSVVIYPFADTEFFKPKKGMSVKELEGESYYLVVSRLVKWKKIDLAIQACADLNLPLIIVGDGSDNNRLRNMAISKKSSRQARTINRIVFRNNVTREELRDFYQNCQALIVTQEEDFGIAAVEAQACGKPVIAYGKGGLAEIIVEGKTGLIFNRQTPDSLKDAIVNSSKVKWDISACRNNALRFSKAQFVRNLQKTIKDYAESNRP